MIETVLEAGSTRFDEALALLSGHLVAVHDRQRIQPSTQAATVPARRLSSRGAAIVWCRGRHGLSSLFCLVLADCSGNLCAAMVSLSTRRVEQMPEQSQGAQRIHHRQ